jgi:hypothetical protein
MPPAKQHWTFNLNQMISIPGCGSNELAANLPGELPSDLKTPATWQPVTLENTVTHPAISSFKAAMVSVTHERVAHEREEVAC